MARKKFLQDLETASNNPPAHITNVKRHDGESVSFSYWYFQDSVKKEVALQLLALDVDNYPEDNQFLLFTDDLDVDMKIANSLEQIQSILTGLPIRTALQEISSGLHQTIHLGSAENPIALASSSPCHESDPDEFNVDDHEDYDDDATFGLNEYSIYKHPKSSSQKPVDTLKNACADDIRRDLLAAKDAGFKVGVHGNLSRAGIVCVSIRAIKLGISEEAMQAWGILRNEYVVLLIRFQRGYKFLAEVKEYPTLTNSVEMVVGLSDTYKPSVDEAFAAFDQLDTGDVTQCNSKPAQVAQTVRKGSLKPLFIGRCLNQLLRDRFPRIVKFRDVYHLHWGGAEKLFNDRQGTLHADLSEDFAPYSEPDRSTLTLTDLVKEDALAEHDVSKASLPLVAMQFVLRHLVRCTEFCPVCHCQVKDSFEALKPYVCSNPLCLFQFLSFGFGPAAEWEILSQPYVVDLLVSLCYSQARVSRLKDFPLGIDLRVPVLPHFTKKMPAIHRHHHQQAQVAQPDEPHVESKMAFKARYLHEKKTLGPVANPWINGKKKLKPGDWIVLVPPLEHRFGVYHGCILEVHGSEFIFGKVIYSKIDGLSDNEITKKASDLPAIEMECYLYDTTFDSLPNIQRHNAIISLLDTLPSVNELSKGLKRLQEAHRDTKLDSLRRQSPPSALDLLRWIIASNRSCIMQVDTVSDSDDTTQKLNPSEQRVSGMDDWMQFRFAQGAPDKEERFVTSVRAHSTQPQHPTLFAWHGSPLYNWHSIVRQGLNFDEVLHGRANGHGVYMSPFLSTSMGYTANSSYAGSPLGWPNSSLKISSVVSLQEVVNAPNQFVSRNPHFVVANQDWIQTRYLFVKTSLLHSKGSATTKAYQQDPLYTARGMKHEEISIPMTAISKSRWPGAKIPKAHRVKKRKTVKPVGWVKSDNDDGMSVATDDEDVSLLYPAAYASDGYESDVFMTDVDEVLSIVGNRSRASIQTKATKKRTHESREGFTLDPLKTKFVPGSLNLNGVRILEPPSYASVAASKALLRAFTDTIRVQETTPLHDLGFYIDPNRVENMYQWIVELHSFDKTLPLAIDMEAAGITSIVCEMLFTNDFPYSPPFIRVVKPRFLDPMSGGGGHITSGGAICMELLTSTGWSVVNSIESVLLQVRLAMSERERPARLLKGRGGYDLQPYAIGEAIAAYKRFCTKHGWTAPKGLDNLQLD